MRLFAERCQDFNKVIHRNCDLRRAMSTCPSQQVARREFTNLGLARSFRPVDMNHLDKAQ